MHSMQCIPKKLLWRSKLVNSLFSSAFFFAVNSFVYLTHLDFKSPFLIHIQINDEHHILICIVLLVSELLKVCVGSALNSHRCWEWLLCSASAARYLKHHSVSNLCQLKHYWVHCPVFINITFIFIKKKSLSLMFTVHQKCLIPCL